MKSRHSLDDHQAQRPESLINGQKHAVFLDRDGVLLRETGKYVTRPEHFRVYPDAAQSVRLLNDADLLTVIVTNQSVVARGMVTEPELQALHVELEGIFKAAAGAWFDRVYYCPFHPAGSVPEYTRPSEMRKPGPGMFLQAAADLKLNLSDCYMVGDQETDIIAARSLGIFSIGLLTEPYGVKSGSWNTKPNLIAPTLHSAVESILSEERRRLESAGGKFA
jgi:histidinol-phosphate phosphatase family protein